ncbi:MAG: gfo/Idh/MocA family oxidoreductase, partial [Acidobacteria bacterium]|nr:gfo/Idh/MocA family oxidoreductase [Acidobacteriota bacterium]
TGPVRVEGMGEYTRAGIWNSPTRYRLTATYADGLPITLAGGHSDIAMGTKWIGEYGWVYVDRGKFRTHPAFLMEEVFGPNEIRLIHSRDHYRNFLDSVKSRQETITPAEIAHRSASVGHLCVIAIKLERGIRFDPATETILDDPEATRLLARSYRSPWPNIVK